MQIADRKQQLADENIALHELTQTEREGLRKLAKSVRVARDKHNTFQLFHAAIQKARPRIFGKEQLDFLWEVLSSLGPNPVHDINASESSKGSVSSGSSSRRRRTFEWLTSPNTVQHDFNGDSLRKQVNSKQTFCKDTQDQPESTNLKSQIRAGNQNMRQTEAKFRRDNLNDEFSVRVTGSKVARKRKLLVDMNTPERQEATREVRDKRRTIVRKDLGYLRLIDDDPNASSLIDFNGQKSLDPIFFLGNKHRGRELSKHNHDSDEYGHQKESADGHSDAPSTVDSSFDRSHVPRQVDRPVEDSSLTDKRSLPFNKSRLKTRKSFISTYKMTSQPQDIAAARSFILGHENVLSPLPCTPPTSPFSHSKIPIKLDSSPEPQDNKPVAQEGREVGSKYIPGTGKSAFRTRVSSHINQRALLTPPVSVAKNKPKGRHR